MSESETASSGAEALTTVSAGDYLRTIFGRLLASNPFYLASAGLLLYGINRFSIDPRLASAELAQLRFNFCALLVYEMLLVVTATMLARKAIWYETLLLVVIENLFVLVPFSLVSRAILLDRSLALAMCGAATGMAVLKFWTIRRYIPELGFSTRLLLFGALMLAANIGISLGFQVLVSNRAALVSGWIASWLFGLPLLASLAWFIPRDIHPRWSALPFGMLVVWLVVTGSHLAGVGYVHEVPWRDALVAPALGVLAWFAWHRSARLGIEPATAWRQRLLFGPMLVTIVAVADEEIFAALSAFNALVYVGIYFHNRLNRRSLLLSFISLTAFTCALPESWASVFMPDFTRATWLLFCGSAGVAFLSAFSRDPRIGLLGSMMVFLSSVCLTKRWETSWLLSTETALAFLLLHSLLWDDAAHRGARFLRFFAAAAWIAHASFWIRSGENAAVATTNSLAVLMLACYAMRAFFSASWRPRIVPVSALAVLLCWPIQRLSGGLLSAPPGFIPIAASFLFFALGTLTAFTKRKWQRSEA